MSIYPKESPEFLGRCLESLTVQILPAAEVVIVKDGILTKELEDDLLVWCHKLPLKIVGYQENRGLAYALNYGLQFCTNDLVARMDSDDISLPDRFEKQIYFFEKNRDVVLISGYISEFKNEPGDIRSVRKVPLRNDEIVKRLKTRNAFNHVTVMFKQSAVLSVGGYNDKVSFFEDYDLWIRMVQAQYKVANIPEILVNVRIGNNMIGRRHGIAYVKKELYFLYLQKKRGFLSNYEYFFLILFRLPLRLIPQVMLKLFYQLLRNNKVVIV
jgi:glycosyltransferase involved in cell wall biosynthesis